MQLVMHIDRCLEHGAIAILARRVMAGKIGAAKMLLGLIGLAQAEVSDQPVELADAQDVGRARRSRLCQVAVKGLSDGSLRDAGCRPEHQLVPQLGFMFSPQMGRSVAVARSCAEFLDDDFLLAEANCAPNVIDAVFSTGTDGEHLSFLCI